MDETATVSTEKQEDNRDGDATTVRSNSLFPLLAQTSSSSHQSSNRGGDTQWLTNRSFNADLSAIDATVSSSYHQTNELEQESESNEEEDELVEKSAQQRPQPELHRLVESSSASSGEDREADKKRRREKKRKTKRTKISSEQHYGVASRKSNVSSWAAPDAKATATKDYYFDSRGDRDNLAFGSLYRMDVARFKPYISTHMMYPGQGTLYQWNRRGFVSVDDNDIDALDTKLKAGGRYWSPKYTVLERHKNLKRYRAIAPRNTGGHIPDDFIPLTNNQVTAADELSPAETSVVEESWEDELLRKTKEFNRSTRECPYDGKLWLEFAKFQDKVASMQPQKGARLQTLEKKISILEKAIELNPEDEELLLHLLNAYQSRDNTDILISRWEKILMQHSGSLKLWKDFLLFCQGEFSRFKISEMRKIYSNAIRALSASRSKLYRQAHQVVIAPSVDTDTIKLELGLVDIYLSLCQFEWQAGHKELATALFQAQMEYSLFSPTLLLSEQSKHRLFEHFWNSDGARIGEQGALGWSTWLGKEEEQRIEAISEDPSDGNTEGGWTGWSVPLSNSKENSENPTKLSDVDVDMEDSDIESESRAPDPEEDTEALLKMLGIDAGPGNEIKDSAIWTRWSQEELFRDCRQWRPVRAKNDDAGGSDAEGADKLLREILFEDVSEYLFSILSKEARLSLVFRFIDFFGGKMLPRTCTNSSSWAEKLASMEAPPDIMLDNLRRMHNNISDTVRKSGNFSFESLFPSSSEEQCMRRDMLKFLRNATLLCLTVFPNNHNLEESALVAEELSNTYMNSDSFSVTPCRALARTLLKSNRQDVLLCGVYAKREAAFGNIEHARKVFDMALASVEALPLDLRLNSSLLYFWYAEMEIGYVSGTSPDSFSRAVHILCCFGSGEIYSPFRCQPSNLLQLRARQGFKEQLKILQPTLARGVVDDRATALICSSALFEELVFGYAAGIEVLTRTFSMVLPERRSQSYELEILFDYYIRMLRRHIGEIKLSEVWDSVLHGLQLYPSSPELYGALIDIGHFHTTSNKLRGIFDNFCKKKPSVITWLFALAFEISRDGSHHRIHGLFERALANEKLRSSVILWRFYMSYLINIACDLSAARRVFFRAIHACPWSKKLWLDGFQNLQNVLTGKELSDLQEVMQEKELNLRTDIYEILLQDET
ncbi:nuclear exosome regulator NRDE2 [Impatiens glandulifera]|uniref:nuclear exosome regulator NRDE2 n=1 Tax=Impatiens glandulifera TaxID=253017 RepID=UPI001FB07804|nr:nuclear exosome regulator NRDE2 [Impatiens glandulifera]